MDLLAAYAKLLMASISGSEGHMPSLLEEAIATTNFATLSREIDSGEWQMSVLLKIAEETLARGGLSKMKRSEIIDASTGFKSAYGELIKAEISRKERSLISEIIDHAFFLGALCSDNIGEGALAKVQEARTLFMRQSKKRHDASRHDKIDAAILAAAGKEPLDESYSFAEWISDKVKTALPKTKGTSVKVIRKRIAILKERR